MKEISSHVLSEICEQFHLSAYTDVTIECKDKQLIHCHALILAGLSHTWKKLLTATDSDQKHVILPEVEISQILTFIEGVYQSLSQQKEQLQCDEVCLKVFGLDSRILGGGVKTETVHDTCDNSKKNKTVKERVKLEGDEIDHDDGHCNGGDRDAECVSTWPRRGEAL